MIIDKIYQQFEFSLTGPYDSSVPYYTYIIYKI